MLVANMTFDEKISSVLAMRVHNLPQIPNIADFHFMFVAQSQAKALRKAKSNAMGALNERFSGSITHTGFSNVVEKMADAAADSILAVFDCARTFEDNSLADFLENSSSSRIAEIAQCAMSGGDGTDDAAYLDDLEDLLVNGTVSTNVEDKDYERPALMKDLIRNIDATIENLSDLEEAFSKAEIAARWDFIRDAEEELAILAENADLYFKD